MGVPRLSIGLPVYNGESLLPEAIEALLGQTYTDFELVIADNASTDGTAEICRSYEAEDSRVRYIRHSSNIGMIANHNFLVGVARGELFKWGSHDDLYDRDYLKRCVDALDEHPEAVLAHSWCVLMDEVGEPVHFFKYPEATAAPQAPQRFRSLIFDGAGDWTYAIFRTSVLRKTPLHASYHGGDRTLMAEFALHGTLYQVPDWLYFRRDHPNRHLSPRERSTIFDPRRASQSAARLYAEYLWGYASAIWRAPLPLAEKRTCYVHMALWLPSRAAPVQEGEEEVSFRTMPLVYVARRLSGMLGVRQAPRATQQANFDTPDIKISDRVPGRKRTVS